MFGDLSFSHILILLLVLVLVFGAKRIPEIGSSLGQGIKEFKRSLKDATSDDPPTAPPPPAPPPPTAHRAPPPRRPTAYLEPPLLGRSEAPERLALAGGRRSEDLAAAVHDLGVRAQRGDELLQSRLLDGPERRFALLIPLLEPRGGVDAGAGQGLQHEPTRFPRNEAAALAPL